MEKERENTLDGLGRFIAINKEDEEKSHFHHRKHVYTQKLIDAPSCIYNDGKKTKANAFLAPATAVELKLEHAVIHTQGPSLPHSIHCPCRSHLRPPLYAEEDFVSLAVALLLLLLLLLLVCCIREFPTLMNASRGIS